MMMITDAVAKSNLVIEQKKIEKKNGKNGIGISLSVGMLVEVVSEKKNETRIQANGTGLFENKGLTGRGAKVAAVKERKGGKVPSSKSLCVCVPLASSTSLCVPCAIARSREEEKGRRRGKGKWLPGCWSFKRATVAAALVFSHQWGNGGDGT